jgi:hypothetical protein
MMLYPAGVFYIGMCWVKIFNSIFHFYIYFFDVNHSKKMIELCFTCAISQLNYISLCTSSIIYSPSSGNIITIDILLQSF